MSAALSLDRRRLVKGVAAAGSAMIVGGRSAFSVAAEILAPESSPDDPRREKQLAPEGDWRVWLLHPGRGWGKGFTAAYWLRDRVRAGDARMIALVGSTQKHVRQLMIENPDSGILAVDPTATYYPGKAEVHWPSGVRALICSAENADEPPLRGGNFDTAWADEVDSWGLETSNDKAETAWDNLNLSVRVGEARMIVTSTPKPGRVVASLLEEAKSGARVVVTTGSTYENAENLSPDFIEELERKYKGTRLERQEIFGEVIEKVHGALWTPDSWQCGEVELEDLVRVVVGVDPSGGGDEIGIVAVGMLAAAPGSRERHFIVLDDYTESGSPRDWAEAAVGLLEKWRGDAIVAERNFGGDMVESTIRSADPNVPVKMVVASRGKVLRAEPIALLYEKKRVWHRAGAELAKLERQLEQFSRTRGYIGRGSPDRADAHVHALTALSGAERPVRLRKVMWG